MSSRGLSVGDVVRTLPDAEPGMRWLGRYAADIPTGSIGVVTRIHKEPGMGSALKGEYFVLLFGYPDCEADFWGSEIEKVED